MSTGEYSNSVYTPGPNFDVGRSGHQITSICIHGTASPQQDIDWWAARASVRGGVHYMVGRDTHIINKTPTQIIQMVQEQNTAWGNGVIDPGCMPCYMATNPNLYTISIEHVKYETDNSDFLTESQVQASFGLILYLCRKYKIPAHWPDDVGKGITMHMLIDPIRKGFCPGPYPFSRLFSYLQENGIPGSY